jgi:hypothetical protein
MKKNICIATSCILLASCATKPSNISAAYVSPLTYSAYDCDQIKMEILRVNSKVSEISGVQQSEASKDAVAMGVGLVVFWPALFFLMGDDKKHELSSLKGHYEALETSAIEKKCDYADQLIADKQRRAEEELRRAEEKRLEKCGGPYSVC